MCPRTKEQNDRIRENRMKQIAEAAADVYLDKGHAMEIRDVALRAGLGYGTVYHYYPNKIRLLEDMLDGAIRPAADLTRQSLAGSGSTTERIERYAAELLALWAARRSTFILYKIASENYHQLPGAPVRTLDERFQSELFAPVAELLRLEAGRTPAEAEQLADMLIASMVGCAGLFLYRKQYRFHTKAIAGMLAAGICAEKERLPS